jgi:DNA-directed RNA polymerase subunit RPC12/RpoP
MYRSYPLVDPFDLPEEEPLVSPLEPYLELTPSNNYLYETKEPDFYLDFDLGDYSMDTRGNLYEYLDSPMSSQHVECPYCGIHLLSKSLERHMLNSQQCRKQQAFVEQFLVQDNQPLEPHQRRTFRSFSDTSANVRVACPYCGHQVNQANLSQHIAKNLKCRELRKRS